MKARTLQRGNVPSALRVLILALFAFPSDALGRGSPARPFETPVVVQMLGPDAVRVRVAVGTNMPCDSSADRPIINGRFAAGDVIRTNALGDGCVCFQQTYAKLADSDWSIPVHLCSACSYNPDTRVWLCPPQREPTITIQVASSRAR